MHPVSRSLALACAICVAACSKSEAASASTRGADSATASAANDGAAPPVDCNKVFVPADVAGIVADPATVSRATMLGPNSCQFVTAQGGNINTTIGSDENSQIEWHDVTATTDSKHYKPISGVGDTAVWHDASNSAWLFAKKGVMYCKVELGLPGGAGAPEVHGVELAKRLGALCNKLFALK